MSFYKTVLIFKQKIQLNVQFFHSDTHKHIDYIQLVNYNHTQSQKCQCSTFTGTAAAGHMVCKLGIAI